MGIAVPSQLLGRQHHNQLIHNHEGFRFCCFGHCRRRLCCSRGPMVGPCCLGPCHWFCRGWTGCPPQGFPALPVAGIWNREAEAEAEPWLGYGLGGWGLAGVAGPKSAPCVNAANIPVPCRGPWKREADAEAEPWLGYAAPYAYAAAPAVGSPVAGLVAHPNGAVTPPYTPAQQAVAADHFARRGGVWWGKRSAEAEPWLGYGYGLAGWGLAGWGPAGIAAPKSAPCVNAWNVPVPC